MKKMKLGLLAIILSVLSFHSCSEQDEEQFANSELRKDITAIIDDSEVKNKYHSLTKEEQLNIWVDKLSQISSQVLTDNQLRLINDLKVEVLSKKSLDLKNSKIRNLAISIAEITPREDFIDMFASLDDYKNNVQKEFNKKTDICTECIESLKDINDNVLSVSSKSSGDCDCKWTCGSDPNHESSSSCTETSSGCGFLWLQPCKRKNVLIGDGDSTNME